MLGSRRVQNLTLHFTQRQQPDRVLGTGVHRLVREANGTIGIGDPLQGALLAQFCVDRRGLWLQVANGMRGIHVNGRPIRRVALLRAGDAVYADGVEMRVQSPVLPATSAASGEASDASDPRMVLRGVGGRHHGRAFPLGRGIVVGSGEGADIRLDVPGVAAAQVRLQRRGDRVLLRDLGSEAGTVVNGLRVRDALLVAGDQLMFDPQARFVVEIPWTNAANDESEAAVQVSAKPGPAATPLSVRRWPWLLLAALLLAGLLAALLLFGAG